MASSSSSDPDQSKKLSNLENSSPEANPPPEAASRSLEGYQQPPAPANASHQSHNPQAMGYPPVIGYPPGHPPPPYPHGYGPYQNYVSAPPPPPHGGYYPNPAYLPPVRQPRSSGFARGVLAAIIILIIISAVFSIVTYIVVRPKEPVFRLASFSVTNFNVSNAVLMGSWEARVMVDNPNEKLTTSFDQIQNLVYYKEPENYLAFSVQGPVSLSTKANTTITLMASTTNSEQPKKWVVEQIEKERKGGVVNFGLGIRLMTTFKSSPWTLYQHIHVSCQDIKVAFGPGSSTGTLATSDKPKECNVYAT